MRPIYLLGFMAATVALIMWVFDRVGVYMMAGFNCADRTSAVRSCAAPIETRAVIEILVAVAVWSLLVWFLFRARAKS